MRNSGDSPPRTPSPEGVTDGEDDAPYDILPSRAGSIVDVRDPRGVWREADVVDTRELRPDCTMLLVHYRFWSIRYNEWLQLGSERVAPAGTHLFTEAQRVPRVGQVVDFRASVAAGAPWRSGTVVSVEPGGGGGGGGGAASARVLVEAPEGDGGRAWVPAEPAQLAPYEWRTRTVVPVAATKQAFWGVRERKAALGAGVDPRVVQYLAALAARGLELVPMGGDGNCLFRSVADQVYGNQERHDLVRAGAARYMRLEAAYFRPFVVDLADGAGWEAYLANIAQAGAWGDDPEVQALSEIYGRPVEIWGYDAAQGAVRLRVFSSGAGGGGASGGGASGGGGGGGAPAAAAGPAPIRLSYYGGGHYDSVRPLQAEWAAGALGSPLLPADAAGRFEEGVLRAAEERGRLAAAAPGAFQQALASSAAESEAAALGEALRQSREQFERAEYGNLELALTRSLAAERGGGGGGAPPPPPPPPSPLPRPPPGAASVEQQILRQTIEQSALEADQKTLEDQQMEAALAESRRMQDAADVAAEKAAAQLSEDEQLECAVRGITAAQFLAEKAAAAGGGGGCAAAGAAGLPLFDLSALGGGGGKGRKR